MPRDDRKPKKEADFSFLLRTQPMKVANPLFTPAFLLCPLSESPSRKRKDLHDNATRKGREIYC